MLTHKLHCPFSPSCLSTRLLSPFGREKSLDRLFPLFFKHFQDLFFSCFLHEKRPKEHQAFTRFPFSLDQTFLFKDIFQCFLGVYTKNNKFQIIQFSYSTVTDFAKLRGLSTSQSRCKAA